ncbi:MAG: assimilatory sulfite reductase (NADPH) flavoprotein subunit [Verrucomicrobiota bacterium]
MTPLNPEQQSLADQLASSADRDQAIWLSGVFYGIGFNGAGTGVPAAAAVPAVPVKKPTLTVLYGSESGNSEKLAGDVKKRATKAGFKASIANMADANPADLSKVENLLVVVSTWGEGDPPDSATSYYEGFMADSMPQLTGLRYSVCGLGDTSYEEFCKMGKDFDSRLASLGGERVFDRVDCDVDFDAPYATWVTGALAAFPSTTVTATTDAAVEVASTAAVVYDKTNPYSAEVTEKILLNATGSEKEVWHVELSLEGSGLTYQPGDALGLCPANRASDIEAVLGATGLQANAKLGDKTLADALRTDFDITTLSVPIAQKYQAIVENADLGKLLEESGQKTFKAWTQGRQLIDLLETYPHEKWTPESFTGILRRLAPRLYSIASSIRAHEDEVHLTVAAVRYETHGRERTGVASTFLADELVVGDAAQVFFHENKNFRLPEDDKAPIIMIGPGTGIAPFRAFIEERAAREAAGKSWLFFGDQRYNYDFLYQLEWQEHLEDGNLDELSLAFSRDQKEKIYVQHRLLERGEEIWKWIEYGAYLYVCGDASRMAKDVNQALLDIIAEHGKMDAKAAKDKLTELRKAKRYQRDVY